MCEKSKKPTASFDRLSLGLEMKLRLFVLMLTAVVVSACSATQPAKYDNSLALSSAAEGVADAVRFTPYSGKSAVGLLEKPYFISFRARNAESYGHSFVAFGERDSAGNIPYDRSGVLIPLMTEIAGLHPASTSDVPYSIGHVVPVPSETGPSDGDTEIAYLQNELTIALSPGEYRKLYSFIKELQSSRPLWHAVAYNCSSFTNEIASYMGLDTANHILFPTNYIESLKNRNPDIESI